MKKRVPSFDDFLNENVNEGKDPLGLGLNTTFSKKKHILKLNPKEKYAGTFEISIGGLDFNRVDLDHLKVSDMDNVYILFTVGTKSGRLKGRTLKLMLFKDGHFETPSTKSSDKYAIYSSDFKSNFYESDEKEFLLKAPEKGFDFWWKFLMGK
ncbi:MAG TPA: hypothetical protein P5509_11285 [Bacteroidales bacterium]|nr:hypothetical protein [Bacteroidales bacterium]